MLSAGLGVATGVSLFAYLVSLFIRQYAAEFGWSRGEIASTAFATLAAGLTAPFIGRLADRVGVRPVILVSVLGFGAVCVAMANQTGDIRFYYALYFLLILFGLGTGSLTWTRVVGVAFARSRGLALSVALSLITVTAMLMPPLLQSVIDAHGWRVAWLVLGALCVGAGLLALVIMPAPPAPTETAAVSNLAQAVRVPAFWLAVTGMFLINVPSGGIMNQMAALIADKGFTEIEAARIMSAFAIAVFLGRLIAGVCLDVFPAHIVAFASMAAPAIGCLLLTNVGGAALAIVILGIVLAGMSQGAEGDIAPFIVARRFGLTAFSGMMGAMSAATAAGTAVGALLFGRVHDHTGSYDIALALGAASFLAGALCYLAIGRSQQAA